MPDGAWALVAKRSEETGWTPLGYWSFANRQTEAWDEIADQIVEERMKVQPGRFFAEIMTDEAYAEAVRESGVIYINVNRHVIARNAKTGEREPPLSIRRGKAGRSSYGHEVAIRDRDGNVVARVIYSPDRPILKCGARVVIVAESADIPQTL